MLIVYNKEQCINIEKCVYYEVVYNSISFISLDFSTDLEFKDNKTAKKVFKYICECTKKSITDYIYVNEEGICKTDKGNRE